MKKYKEYMNRIKVSDELYEKIMRGEKRKTPDTGGIIFKFATAAAGIAAVAVCAFIVYGLLGTGLHEPGIGTAFEPPYYLADGEAGIPGEAAGIIDSNPDYTNGADISQEPLQLQQTPPVLPSTIDELTFNAVESAMSYSRALTDTFGFILSPEQQSMVFPRTGLSLAANAFFFDCGTVRHVTLIEYEFVGETRTGERFSLSNPEFTFTGLRVYLGEEGTVQGNTIITPAGRPIVSYVQGVPVTAFVYNHTAFPEDSFQRNRGVGVDLFSAKFTLDGVDYHALSGGADREHFIKAVNLLIYHGAADLNALEYIGRSAVPPGPDVRPVTDIQEADIGYMSIAEASEPYIESITFEEARADTWFGSFIPDIPDRLILTSAVRRECSVANNLTLVWYSDCESDFILWLASEVTENDRRLLVSPDRLDKFCIHMYTGEMPWSWRESVPDELYEYFRLPLFRADEFSPDIIRARTRRMENYADIFNPMSRPESYQTLRFGVVFGDVVIRISGYGISPEEMFEIFFGGLI